MEARGATDERAAILRRWSLLLVPAVLVCAGLLARATAARAFTAFTRYDPAFTFAPAPQQPGPPLTGRVVLVLMDGLGLDVSRSMPFLNELRGRGAAFECRIGQPSLSLPGRAVLMTGAWQEIHGQATNYHPRPLAVEHVFQLARSAGRSTGLAAGSKTQALFAPHVERRAVYEQTPETAPFERYEAALRHELAASLGVLRERPGLAQVELDLADEAGHGWGAASPQYARAAAEVDAAVRELAAELDLERDTLVVTADHGHVAAGGHGGPEPEVMRVPLVMAGRGIRRGAAGACAQVDVAPTLAVLLGVPIPAANQGVPLLAALELGPEARARVLANAVRQREAFVSAYAARLGSADAAVAPAAFRLASAAGGDEAALGQRLATLAAAEAAARDSALAREAAARRRKAAALMAVVLALLAAAFRFQGITRADGALAATAGLAGAALHHLALPAAGLGYSLTAVNKDEWLGPFFMKDMALGVASCALPALAACVYARRRGRTLTELCRLAWACAAVFCSVFALIVAVIYARQDVFPRWSLPDQAWGMAFYLDVLALMAAGLAAPALALVAGLARLAPVTAARAGG